MRKSTKFLGALAVAGLVAAGGSAFTFSNTFTTGIGVSGYGQSTATGAVVATVVNTLKANDASRLDTVTFTTLTDVTGKTAQLTLKNGDIIFGSSYACTNADTVTPWTIVCSTASDYPLLSAYDSTGLTVVE